MSYISLYRKYRPSTFNDVVGQDIVVQILKNSILNDQINHAYIFSGPRGTGKTSIAKIFAKAVNCLNKYGDICNKCEVCLSSQNNEIDIIEMDAASNNSVDEIREIINNVKYLPSKLKYKVYIIDEVHMLSTSAFNALLKTLEEPPSHVIFILATTEFNKIPATVISRCQKLDFKKITDEKIVERLEYILDKENKKVNKDVLNLIAKISDGGLRDSINLLDQILTLENENITTDQVYNLIGELSENEIFELFDTIINYDVKKMLNDINNYTEKGINFISIINRMELLVRNLLVYNSTNGYFDSEYESKLQKYNKIDVDKIIMISNILFELINELKKTNNQKTLIEIYFLKMLLIFSGNNNVLIKDTNEIKEIVEKKENKENNEIKTNLIEEESKDDKKININNALYGANKEMKISFLKKYKDISEYVSSKEYNSISNLLLKATPEVISDKNILFTFKNSFEVVLFDKNIEDIQKFLKMLYNKQYTVCAVSNEEWLKIKEEYIQNIKSGVKYEYIKEKPKTKKNIKNTELQNSVENIFGSDYTTI